MIQNTIVVLDTNAYNDDSSDSDTDQQYLLEKEESLNQNHHNNSPVISLWRPFKKPLGPQPQTGYFKMASNFNTSNTTSTSIQIPRDNSNDNNNNNINNNLNNNQDSNSNDILVQENNISNDNNDNDNNNSNNQLPIYKRVINSIKGFSISTWIKIAIFICMVTTILVVVFRFKVQDNFFTYLEKLQNFTTEHTHGRVIGGFIYMGAFSLLIIFLIPVTIPTIVGGVIFGFWYGLLFVWSASMIGGSASFLLGRFVFRKKIRSLISKRPKMKAVDEAVGKESWKLVLLLRLTPIVPESILNYALSVAPLNYTKYVICSAFGLIPGTSFFIYLGKLFGSIADFQQNGFKKMGKGQIVLYVVSGVLMIVNIVFISVIVKRAVNKRLDQQQNQDNKETQDIKQDNSSVNSNDQIKIEIEEEKEKLELQQKQQPLDINKDIQIEINVYNNSNSNNDQSSVNSSYNNNNFEDDNEIDESASLLGSINNSSHDNNNNDNNSSFKRIIHAFWWFSPKKQHPILVN